MTDTWAPCPGCGGLVRYGWEHVCPPKRELLAEWWEVQEPYLHPWNPVAKYEDRAKAVHYKDKCLPGARLVHVRRYRVVRRRGKGAGR